jgi:energy-coupling factor transport system substrate-specific component
MDEDQGNSRALGIIETRGRSPLIEAVDSAIKAAAVTLKKTYFVGGGLNAVTLVGDVGAMRAALDAAKSVISRMGAEGQTHLIPRLAPDVWVMLETEFPPVRPPEDPKPGPEKPPESPAPKTPAKDEAPGKPEKAAVENKAPAPKSAESRRRSGSVRKPRGKSEK